MTARTGMSRRWAATAALAVAVVLGLTACGAPAWNYVTNKEERTYAKVPAAWRDVSAEISPAQGVFGIDPKALTWVRAFDADATPSIDHAMGVAATESPTMVVVVLDVPEEVRGVVALDSLRDFVFPVSERAQMSMTLQPRPGLSGFKLFADKTLTPGDGLRGVRSIFGYSINNGPPQVFDQTAYTNEAASKIYMIIVRCSLECFTKNSAQINDVASSFTVREKL
jgi:hypothetical protein